MPPLHYGYTHTNGIGRDAVIFVPSTSDKKYTLIMDHRKIVHAILDENGAEIGRRQYDAFGVILSQTGTWPTDLAYQTNWQTIQIGNKWWGLSAARMYDFASGQFASRDTIGVVLDRTLRASGNALGLFNNTSFVSEILRFISRKMTPRTILYSMLFPTLKVDPIGWAETDCTEADCNGLKPIEEKINKMLNEKLADLKKEGKNPVDTARGVYDRFGPVTAEDKFDMVKRGIQGETMRVTTSRIERDIRGDDFKDYRKDKTKENSIYKDVDNALIALELSCCVLLCKQCVGADKVAHILEMGLLLLTVEVSGQKRGNTPEQIEAAVKKYNRSTEFNIAPNFGNMGESMTGVMSNADLAANEVGLKLYREIFSGKGDKPLDICDFVKGHDLSEETNPNDYRQDVKDKVKKRG